MNNFKNNRGFNSGRKEGFKSFGKPKFGASGGFRGFNKDRNGTGGRDLELFQATCAQCGKTCEVPFRPNGKKPVYCKECFALQNGGSDSSSFAPRPNPRRDFDAKPAFRSEPRQEYKSQYNTESKPAYDNGMADLKKQMQTMNMKLDSLMQLLAKSAAPRQEAPIEAPVKGKTEKKEARKAAKKVKSKK